MNKKKLNKREFSRLDLETKINVSSLDITNAKAKASRMKAVGKNIGIKGILVVSDKKLKRDTLVTLEIFMPGKKKPIYIEGDVRWCVPINKKAKNPRKFEVGIQFLTVEKEHIVLFLEYVCGDVDKK